MGGTVSFRPFHSLNYFLKILSRPTKATQTIFYIKRVANYDRFHSNVRFLPLI